MKPKNYPTSDKRRRMSNHHGVVLPGIAAYAKVQSYELRAFDVTPQEKVLTHDVMVAETLINEIKVAMMKPEMDKFPVQTLQIPDDLEQVLQELPKDEDDGNSSDPSE